MSKDGVDKLFKHFPVIETDNLLLREVTHDDDHWLFSIFSDPEVVEFYDIYALENLDQATEMIDRWGRRFENREGLRWGITQSSSDEVIGTIGLYIQSEWKAALGYDVRRSHWRRGIMTEAITAVIRLAFNQAELERLEALVIPGNQASEKLLEKLGFTNEGTLRHYAYFKDSHHDLQCYSLLRSEFGS